MGFSFNLLFLFFRSQVVREACITVAYMSQVLRLKVDRFLEALMQNLINLIPNAAKIMSSSGIVAMRFIIQNTFSQKFLPIICSNIASKSREIRRHCCEFLDQLLHTWPTQPLVRIIFSKSKLIFFQFKLEEDRKAKIPPISNLAGDDKRKRVSNAKPGGLSWILKVSQI